VLPYNNSAGSTTSVLPYGGVPVEGVDAVAFLNAEERALVVDVRADQGIAADDDCGDGTFLPDAVVPIPGILLMLAQYSDSQSW
jgi:hypothetical protein